MTTMHVRTATRAVGLACLLASVDFLLWGGAFTMHEYASTFGSGEIRLLYTIPSMLTLGLFLLTLSFITTRSHFPTFEPRASRFLACGLTCMTVGIALLGTLHIGQLQNHGLLFVAGILSGAGIALSLFAWQSALACLPKRDLLSTISLACLLFPIVPLILILIRSGISFVVISLLCWVSYVAFRIERKRLPQNRPAAVEPSLPAQRTLVSATLHQSASTLICLGSLGFVAGISRTSTLSAEPASAGIMWGSLACMFSIALMLIFIWRVLGIDLTITRFYQVGFVLTTTSLVISLAISNDFSALSAWLPYLLFEFALFLVMATCTACEPERESNPVALFGLQTGVAYLALGLGTLLGFMLCEVAGDTSSVFGLTIGLCIYALSMPLLFLFRKHASPDSEAISGASQPANLDPHAFYASRVRLLANTHGLTPREEEIVVLTACGLDSPAIARKLSVSDNTVRTHKRNAYKKLGIHSKQDLLALLSMEPGTPPVSS